jgi:hypothetical protein
MGRLRTLLLAGALAGAVGGSASADSHGVVICHKPGTPAEKTLRLPETAARSHVASHGDTRGPCPRKLDARLSGYQQVPPVSTSGRGSFAARFDREARVLRYRLRFADLEGDVLFAHVHFAPRGVEGGVIAWLCAAPGTAGAPAETPVCEGISDEVRGSLSADDVVGPADQGIEPGEAMEALAAVARGLAYVNVHSALYPDGEIRGQIGE